MQQPENKHEPVNLGQYIRQRRLGQGLSLRKLAEKLELNRTYLTRLEKGKSSHPSPEILQRIAVTLGIAYENLFAIAGYAAPETLPDFVPYLRAKYPQMDDAAADELNQLRIQVMYRHDITEGHLPTPEPDYPELPGPLPYFN